MDKVPFQRRRQRAAHPNRYAARKKRTKTTILAAFFLAISQLSFGQTCRDLESLIYLITPGIDTILIKSYGGYLPGNQVASVDATGRVMLLDYRHPPGMNRSADVDPEVFQELIAMQERAVELLRSRGSWPSPMSSEERREAVREGRLEPYCRSLDDGIDIDVVVRVGTSTNSYRCVTGELYVFAEQVFDFAAEAVALSERMYCP